MAEVIASDGVIDKQKVKAIEKVASQESLKVILLTFDGQVFDLLQTIISSCYTYIGEETIELAKRYDANEP